MAAAMTRIEPKSEAGSEIAVPVGRRALERRASRIFMIRALATVELDDRGHLAQ